MYPKEIPRFIEDVMEQIEIGIERVAQKKLVDIGVDKSLIHVSYPARVEMMLNIDIELEDPAIVDEVYVESHTIWVKIPWPERVV